MSEKASENNIGDKELQELIDQRIEQKKEEIKKEALQEIEKQKTKKPTKNSEEDISRREFLKKAGLGLGGLAALSAPVSADFFIKDDSFSVQTSNDNGDTLTEGLFVDQNANVEIPNGDLDMGINKIYTGAGGAIGGIDVDEYDVLETPGTGDGGWVVYDTTQPDNQSNRPLRINEAGKRDGSVEILRELRVSHGSNIIVDNRENGQEKYVHKKLDEPSDPSHSYVVLLEEFEAGHFNFTHGEFTGMRGGSGNNVHDAVEVTTGSTQSGNHGGMMELSRGRDVQGTWELSTCTYDGATYLALNYDLNGNVHAGHDRGLWFTGASGSSAENLKVVEYYDEADGNVLNAEINDSLQLFNHTGQLKISNANLNLDNNNLDNVNQINGQNADDFGGEGVPEGVITMWSGAISDIPDGWTLCDGSDGAPDLQNRFIVGAGDEYNIDDTGGEKEVQLKESEIPSHSHSIPVESDNDAFDYVGIHNGSMALEQYSRDNISTNSSGGDEAHENRPPYYALAYIMKI